MSGRRSERVRRFRAALQAVIESRGLSLREVAELTDVPSTSIHNWLIGKTYPDDPGQVTQMADGLEQPRSVFLSAAGYYVSADDVEWDLSHYGSNMELERLALLLSQLGPTFGADRVLALSSARERLSRAGEEGITAVRFIDDLEGDFIVRVDKEGQPGTHLGEFLVVRCVTRADVGQLAVVDNGTGATLRRVTEPGMAVLGVVVGRMTVRRE